MEGPYTTWMKDLYHTSPKTVSRLGLNTRWHNLRPSLYFALLEYIAAVLLSSDLLQMIHRGGICHQSRMYNRMVSCSASPEISGEGNYWNHTQTIGQTYRKHKESHLTALNSGPYCQYTQWGFYQHSLGPSSNSALTLHVKIDLMGKNTGFISC